MLSTGQRQSVLGSVLGSPPGPRPASSNSNSTSPLGDNVTSGDAVPAMRPGSATDAVLRRSSLELDPDLGSQPPACCRHREPANTTESERSDSPSCSADALAHSAPLPQSLSAPLPQSLPPPGGTSFTKRREEGSFNRGRREDGSFTKGRSFRKDGSKKDGSAHGSAGAGSEAVAVSCFLPP